MSQASSLAARMLEASASGFAGFSASLLLERHPEIEKRFAPDAMATWKTHLGQRILELAAAIEAGEPELFISDIEWTRSAFRAREMPEKDLRSSLVCLRDVLRENLPEAASHETDHYLNQALTALEEPLSRTERGLDAEQPNERLALEYLQAGLEGDSLRAIDRILQAVDEGLAVQEAYLQILLPALQEVGRMWHAGEISVAEEHLVSATTRRAMAILSQRGVRQPANGKTAIVAAVAGNNHDLVVRAVADFFEMAGWRTVFLGADVPHQDLSKAVQYFAANLVALSATLSTQLNQVQQTIESIRQQADDAVRVIVGGQVFAHSPELWQRVGADGYAPTADAAVSLAARLVELEVGPDRDAG